VNTNITLNEVEKVYTQIIQDTLSDGRDLSAHLLIDLSVKLFNEIEVKDIGDDMLLFQYGTYDWGNEHGEHFSFDITRQFIDPAQHEPYQLSLTLVYEPQWFKSIAPYDCWSMDYVDINSFAANIKTTSGFKAACENKARAYEIHFEQC